MLYPFSSGRLGAWPAKLMSLINMGERPFTRRDFYYMAATLFSEKDPAFLFVVQSRSHWLVRSMRAVVSRVGIYSEIWKTLVHTQKEGLKGRGPHDRTNTQQQRCRRVAEQNGGCNARRPHLFRKLSRGGKKKGHADRPSTGPFAFFPLLIPLPLFSAFCSFANGRG